MSEPISTEVKYTPIVLFDDTCPYCSREIAHYRKRKGAESIEWIPIAQTDNLEERYGITLDAAMKHLHVRDKHGDWQVGAYAFAELWSNIRSYSWLAKLLRKSQLLPVINKAYNQFASLRFKRRCVNGTCSSH